MPPTPEYKVELLDDITITDEFEAKLNEIASETPQGWEFVGLVNWAGTTRIVFKR